MTTTRHTGSVLVPLLDKILDAIDRRGNADPEAMPATVKAQVET